MTNTTQSISDEALAELDADVKIRYDAADADAQPGDQRYRILFRDYRALRERLRQAEESLGKEYREVLVWVNKFGAKAEELAELKQRLALAETALEAGLQYAAEVHSRGEDDDETCDALMRFDEKAAAYRAAKEGGT